MSTLYLQLDPAKVNKYVVFSGDPSRVKRVAALLDHSEKIAENREYVTYSGTYKGVGITVTSTGIGGPSTAIAMEEMYDCGMEVAIRIGTIMGLHDNLGEMMIPRATMRKESTSKEYVDAAYPAVSDFELLHALSTTAEKMNLTYSNSIICSLDRFYGDMKTSSLAKQLDANTEDLFNELKKYQINGIDMESGTLLTLANLMNIKGAVVTLTTVTENVSKMLENREEMDDQMLKLVLEGIVHYHEEKNAQ